jgi:3-methyladenine DNA glycosylase Tag
MEFSTRSQALSPERAETPPMRRPLTVIYAHMQAVGMVNDHLIGCFRHREVGRLGISARSVHHE